MVTERFDALSNLALFRVRQLARKIVDNPPTVTPRRSASASNLLYADRHGRSLRLFFFHPTASTRYLVSYHLLGFAMKPGKSPNASGPESR